MMTLDPIKQRRLIGALRLTSSDKDGERQAAMAAALRIAESEGVDLASVVERGLAGVAATVPFKPEPVDPRESWVFRTAGGFTPWRRKARNLLQRPQSFNERETTFLRDMAARSDHPTERQSSWLESLCARVSE